MPKNTNEIVVGANGTVRVAPYGTALPTTVAAAPNAAFIDLGYVSEDGVTIKDAKTTSDINVWQSFYAARKLITARDFSISFVLRQWSGPQVEFAFGGATVTAAGGEFKVSPPAAETLDIRSMLVDWSDGSKNFRLVIPRGIVSEDVETKLVRDAAADLPIGFSVLAVDGVDPYNIYTNDATFAEAT